MKSRNSFFFLFYVCIITLLHVPRHRDFSTRAQPLTICRPGGPLPSTPRLSVTSTSCGGRVVSEIPLRESLWSKLRSPGVRFNGLSSSKSPSHLWSAATHQGDGNNQLIKLISLPTSAKLKQIFNTISPNRPTPITTGASLNNTIASKGVTVPSPFATCNERFSLSLRRDFTNSDFGFICKYYPFSVVTKHMPLNGLTMNWRILSEGKGTDFPTTKYVHQSERNYINRSTTGGAPQADRRSSVTAVISSSSATLAAIGTDENDVKFGGLPIMERISLRGRVVQWMSRYLPGDIRGVLPLRMTKRMTWGYGDEEPTSHRKDLDGLDSSDLDLTSAFDGFYEENDITPRIPDHIASPPGDEKKQDHELSTSWVANAFNRSLYVPSALPYHKILTTALELRQRYSDKFAKVLDIVSNDSHKLALYIQGVKNNISASKKSTAMNLAMLSLLMSSWGFGGGSVMTALLLKGLSPLTALTGLLLVGMSMMDMGSDFFKGIPSESQFDDIKLKVDGIFSIVRHPAYAGMILLALGSAIGAKSTERILLAAALSYYLTLVAQQEEATLEAGVSQYAEYRRNVPFKFIPRVI